MKMKKIGVNRDGVQLNLSRPEGYGQHLKNEYHSSVSKGGRHQHLWVEDHWAIAQGWQQERRQMKGVYHSKLGYDWGDDRLEEM
jgi:hypothetical protein